MQEVGFGQPVLCEGVHALPCHAVALTASAQRLTPLPPDGVATSRAQTPMAGHGIVPRVPQQHALQPGTLRRDGPVQAPPPCVFACVPFRAEMLGWGAP